ncbi:MAG: imidazole glycerol phosphate synthase subunit HisH [Proteobacteria bacterium]|nr:imidazole glycerol phosphate synthase subunit HisH [Pseudomonadota bacterium]
MPALAVVDYNSGNLYSVVKALELTAPAGTDIVIATTAADVERAERVVFPGQGSAGACLKHLHASGMTDAVRQAAQTKPFLGICMGMQLMFAHSEEGEVDCLALIDEAVSRLRAPAPADSLRLPHIGWNRVRFVRPHPVFPLPGREPWFYFVHSYAWVNAGHDHAVGISTHGQPFCAALAHDNIVCTQFHPEKSSRDGLSLLHNFQRWQPSTD